jgi:hypothetical protein
MAHHNKVRLNEAFRALRKHGLIARQNFMCCSSCACSQIANDAEKLVDKGQKIAGGVFYHKQDGDNLRDGREFYVRFGQIDTQKHGVLGISDEQIGRLVIQEFEKARIRAQWDGNIRTAILVQPGEPDPKTIWERL